MKRRKKKLILVLHSVKLMSEKQERMKEQKRGETYDENRKKKVGVGEWRTK